MNSSYSTLFLLVLATILFGCQGTIPVYQIEERNLDTVFVRASKNDYSPSASTYPDPYYRATPQRTTDIVHTQLQLSFDWQKEQVTGQAKLTLTPWFYPLDTVRLDAKQLRITNLTVEGKPVQNWHYDSIQLHIPLATTKYRLDTFQIQLNYVANPSASGGSNTIQSNQGLFFINSSGSKLGVPRQIWTQGETQWNSRWFPTIDHPNERFTQDIRLTVDTVFTTLSNGILTETTPHGDGTRTDRWVLDLPHAPYLSMIAVGQFAAVSDQWRNVPLTYYVEPGYREHAPYIFARTPEMLTFFSERFDFPFPWPSYAQIVVREFVSGAMENTTAVVFGDFVQQRRRALIDNPNDNIVAHELVHHWFGNLVTCESWANLTLNEGFANYGEYLWLEHWYGREEADFHMYMERDGYFRDTDPHPLIHFRYEDAEDMFDSHSYNKGGAVLHMLRYELGDEAFFAGLNYFLRKHQFSAIEVHDLRLAMETVSGLDLNWFFHQWYLTPGHPVLDITYDYDTITQELIIDIQQTQDPQPGLPAFRLPIQFDIYMGEQPVRITRILRKRKQTLRIPVPQYPELIIVDPEGILLAEITEQKSPSTYVKQFTTASHFASRWRAWQQIKKIEAPLPNTLWQAALGDSFRIIRAKAAESAPMPDNESTLIHLANTDPHASVRSQALLALARQRNHETIPIIERALRTDSSFAVIGAALQALTQIDERRALQYAAELQNVPESKLLVTIAGLYTQQEDCAYLSFFTTNLISIDRQDIFSFLNNYQQLSYQCGTESVKTAGALLHDLGTNEGQSVFHRYAATSALNELTMSLQYDTNAATNDHQRVALQHLTDQLHQWLYHIKQGETNPQLKKLYRQLPSIRPEPK